MMRHPRHLKSVSGKNSQRLKPGLPRTRFERVGVKKRDIQDKGLPD